MKKAGSHQECRILSTLMLCFISSGNSYQTDGFVYGAELVLRASICFTEMWSASEL